MTSMDFEGVRITVTAEKIGDATAGDLLASLGLSGEAWELLPGKVFGLDGSLASVGDLVTVIEGSAGTLRTFAEPTLPTLMEDGAGRRYLHCPNGVRASHPVGMFNWPRATYIGALRSRAGRRTIVGWPTQTASQPWPWWRATLGTWDNNSINVMANQVTATSPQGQPLALDTVVEAVWGGGALDMLAAVNGRTVATSRNPSDINYWGTSVPLLWGGGFGGDTFVGEWYGDAIIEGVVEDREPLRQYFAGISGASLGSGLRDIHVRNQADLDAIRPVWSGCRLLLAPGEYQIAARAGSDVEIRSADPRNPARVWRLDLDTMQRVTLRYLDISRGSHPFQNSWDKTALLYGGMSDVLIEWCDFAGHVDPVTNAPNGIALSLSGANVRMQHCRIFDALTGAYFMALTDPVFTNVEIFGCLEDQCKVWKSSNVLFDRLYIHDAIGHVGGDGYHSDAMQAQAAAAGDDINGITIQNSVIDAWSGDYAPREGFKAGDFQMLFWGRLTDAALYRDAVIRNSRLRNAHVNGFKGDVRGSFKVENTEMIAAPEFGPDHNTGFNVPKWNIHAGTEGLELRNNLYAAVPWIDASVVPVVDLNNHVWAPGQVKPAGAGCDESRLVDRNAPRGLSFLGGKGE